MSLCASRDVITFHLIEFTDILDSFADFELCLSCAKIAANKSDCRPQTSQNDGYEIETTQGRRQVQIYAPRNRDAFD